MSESTFMGVERDRIDWSPVLIFQNATIVWTV